MISCSTTLNLPPGFRFHPTDDELITHYLINQLKSAPSPWSVSMIPEVNIYKFDPWQLPTRTGTGGGGGKERERYFFSPRERKYPNGVRPNRATASGYWKATGTDKAIYSNDRHCVGVKKALVFYKGRPPKGTKTGWIMHEYRLSNHTSPPDSIRLDEWVLCRIYESKKQQKITMEEGEEVGGRRRTSELMEREALRFPKSFSLVNLLEAEYMSETQMVEDYGWLGSNDDFHALASSFLLSDVIQT